ncbi:hypothetical protein DDE18_11820 [Nocardioides gansuensis]|uniref:Mycothiol-dependent maleylpyruvate isomerase metal-binding domain-containing protein n=2 Tax=Nocardioides gansuensis TaxID=2138300 RepID=A0A2T8FBJ0_9ACTN|nr:hypothetical protein DDE18_11820 [Nocardioides gansuensis]
MTRLRPEQYLDHIRLESAAFRAALADCDPGAPVPSCPDWTAADLLHHLTDVQHFWAEMVRNRPAGPHGYVEVEQAPDHAAALAAYDAASAGLLAALEGLAPDVEAWTWAAEPGDHSVGFIQRRQAHEALIHRLDAELAARISTPVDPLLAADGVHEAIGVMYGGCPPWGSFTPSGQHVRLDCTDTGHSVWVALGTFSGTDPRTDTTYADEPDVNLADDPGVEPDVVVDGEAAALDAWLWHRGDDAGLTVAGDQAVFERFREVVSTPIT